jgi:hypothetical protein
LAGATACSSEPRAAQDTRKRYLCEAEQSLDVVRSKDIVIVRVGERIFNKLRAKQGSLGERFTDGEATLILDGDSAVFVTADGLNLASCELQP